MLCDYEGALSNMRIFTKNSLYIGKSFKKFFQKSGNNRDLKAIE